MDRGVKVLRCLEISLDEGQGAGRVLLPIHHCEVHERERDIRVTALHRGQLNDVPRPRAPDSITARDEDMVNACCAGAATLRPGEVLVWQGRTGNVSIRLKPGQVVGYAKLWPHARPWRLRRPEPMLRSLPDAGRAAAILSRMVAEARRREAGSCWAPPPCPKGVERTVEA